jgi:hypothetical protein
VVQHLQAFWKLLATHRHHILVIPLLSSNCRHPIAILKAPQLSSSTVSTTVVEAASLLLPSPLALPFLSPSLPLPLPSSPSSLTYINVVPSLTSNRHSWIAAIVFIDIFAVNGGGIIGIAVAVAIAIAVSAIPVVAVIVDAYCCFPIVVVQLPSSNRHPWISTIVVINIIWIGGGSSIIAIAFAITIAIAVSAIAVITIIVSVALPTLLRHHRHCHAPWQPIGGSGQTMPQGHCPWHADGALTLGSAAQGPPALTQGLILSCRKYHCV